MEEKLDLQNEKKTNENRKEILKRYFPKGIDFSILTKEEVNKTVYEISNKPLKILSWKNLMRYFDMKYITIAFNLTI